MKGCERTVISMDKHVFKRQRIRQEILNNFNQFL